MREHAAGDGMAGTVGMRAVYGAGLVRTWLPLAICVNSDLLFRVGARVAVVSHDARPYAGSRILDKLRRVAQLHVQIIAPTTELLVPPPAEARRRLSLNA